MFIRKHLWAICFSLCLIGFTAYLLLDTFAIRRVYTVVPQTGSSVSSAEDSSNAVAEDSETGDADTAPGAIETDTEDIDSTVAAGTDSTENTVTNGAGDVETDSTENTGTEATDTGSAGDTGSEGTEAKDDESTSSYPVTTANSYSDGNISITLTEYRKYDTTIYVADVQITSESDLKTAFADSSYGRNITEKTSKIAEDVNAILAVNGDFYGAQESGYVIRNGVLYRDTAAENRQDLVIYEDGSFEVVEESEITAQELLDKGAWQVLSFGPGLVEDGEIAVSENEEVGKAMASNPRTALGVTEDGHYLFVVSDGRTSESEGLSLYEMAEFMQSLGAVTAYNLDGGGSSTMYFNGEVVNNPTTSGRSIKERSVSDIVYIGY